MNSKFEEPLFREMNIMKDNSRGNVIKSSLFDIKGKTKISVDEEGHKDIKVILKKDEKDSVKEIKFVCSCGLSKSIILDYSE